MTDAPVLAEVEQESENATEELTNWLLFVNAKNQFKWNGSVELFESFSHQNLGLSADVVTKSSNGTCSVRLLRLLIPELRNDPPFVGEDSEAAHAVLTVWKTPRVTFNLYTKTKTLPIQGKAVDYTRDLLLQTIQAVRDGPLEK